MKNYKDFKKEALKSKELKRAYDALTPEFSIAQAVIEKRLEKGLTQRQLAEKVGTKQSAISRLESGSYNPSINFLEKVAKALNLRLMVSMG
jgi:ribosome-binding protein aMBF1 (putative translation factor)